MITIVKFEFALISLLSQIVDLDQIIADVSSELHHVEPNAVDVFLVFWCVPNRRVDTFIC